MAIVRRMRARSPSGWLGRAIILTVAALTAGVAAVAFATSYGALYAFIRDTGLYSERLARVLTRGLRKHEV